MPCFFDKDNFEKKTDMKKIYATLLLLIGLTQYSNAQWPHVGTSGLAVNTSFGIYSSDLLVISPNEIYVAAFQMNNGQGEKSLKVMKYDGTNWVSMGEVIADYTIGTIIMRKAPDGSIYLAYSKLNPQSNIYELMLMKYEGNKWQNIAPFINLPSSISYFDFVIDNNNVPIILGSKSFVIDLSRVSKFENNAWVHTTIPNSAGTVFNINTCTITPNNDLIYVWQKTQFVNGALVSLVYLDTLSGSTFTTGTENITGKLSSLNQIVKDSSNNITILNTEYIPSNYVLTQFKNVNGTWSTSKSDTVAEILLMNFTVGGSGQILCTNSSNKIYNTSNFSSPIYTQTTPASSVYKVRLLGSKVYALINDGVIVGDLSNNPNGINSNKLTGVSLYPNPSSDIVSLKGIDEQEVESLKVFNIIGEEVKQLSASNTIDIQELNSGIYILEITSKSGQVGRVKFIKE